jgi:hypothetical protein
VNATEARSIEDQAAIERATALLNAHGFAVYPKHRFLIASESRMVNPFEIAESSTSTEIFDRMWGSIDAAIANGIVRSPAVLRRFDENSGVMTATVCLVIPKPEEVAK